MRIAHSIHIDTASVFSSCSSLSHTYTHVVSLCPSLAVPFCLCFTRRVIYSSGAVQTKHMHTIKRARPHATNTNFEQPFTYTSEWSRFIRCYAYTIINRLQRVNAPLMCAPRRYSTSRYIGVCTYKYTEKKDLPYSADSADFVSVHSRQKIYRSDGMVEATCTAKWKKKSHSKRVKRARRRRRIYQ